MRNCTTHLGMAMLICAALGLSGAGCQTSKPGVTDTVGRIDAVIEAPPPRVTQAATNVLENDYHFKLLSTAYTTIDGRVEAESAQGTKVWVWVAKKDDNSSAVSMRVGLTGDEKLSLEMLDKIKARSKTLMDKLRETM